MSGDGTQPPLDAATAASRARQVAVLAEPTRLRIMSVLATQAELEHTVSTVAAELDLDVAAAREHVAALRDAQLIEALPGREEPRLIPSAEAWVRFGRLLSGKPSYAPPVAPEGAATIPDLALLPSQLQRVADRLAYRYSSHFSRETVDRYVAESYQLLASRAKTARHLPSLTSRFASERLGALAAAQGFDLTGTPEVLFVCVQNSGRSQIAAGLLRSLAGPQVHVRTAGSQPAGAIDPVVVQVLEEVGVPLVAEFPKPLTDEVVQAADIVITMGCGDACPVYPGRRYMDWKIDDPLGRPVEDVRAIRDRIRGHIDDLVNGLGLLPRDYFYP